jgi:hypothetical protein
MPEELERLLFLLNVSGFKGVKERSEKKYVEELPNGSFWISAN